MVPSLGCKESRYDTVHFVYQSLLFLLTIILTFEDWHQICTNNTWHCLESIVYRVILVILMDASYV